MFKFFYSILLVIILANISNSFAMNQKSLDIHGQPIGNNQDTVPSEGVTSTTQETLEDADWDSDVNRQIKKKKVESTTRKNQIHSFLQEINDSTDGSESDSEDETSSSTEEENAHQKRSGGESKYPKNGSYSSKSRRSIKKYKKVRRKKKKHKNGVGLLVKNENLCWGLGIAAFCIWLGYRYYTFVDDRDESSPGQ